MTTPFAHLHLHTEYSLADSTVRIGELAQRAAQQSMPAVAVTDVMNVFAMVKFYRRAMDQGVKPIIGADIWLENTAGAKMPFRAALLCQDRRGYQNLSRLLTRAYREGQMAGRPCIRKAWLGEANGGLIALSGAEDGDIGHALRGDSQARARRLADEYRVLFGDRFYLELRRTGHPGQEQYLQAALALALEKSIPVVATNAVTFLRAEDFDAHEVRVCIHEGRTLRDGRRPRRFTEQQYFRSNEEMSVLFADIPEAISNSLEIAKRCNLHLQLGKNFLPKFPVAQGDSVADVLMQRARSNLERTLTELRDSDGRPIDAEQRSVYMDRLDHELGVINEMGFPGYFLIVADFIEWSKRNDIPVGPGRGSGAGSLVAYVLGITELDPIIHGLLFERFLNPERVSLPDFDIDFCMEQRDRVIDYVSERYGRDQVAQIITYGTMAARAVVRDVGRVLDHPYGFCDTIAKLIPFEVGMTLERALEQEELLRERYEQDDDVHELIDMARALEGIARNAGKHAGGVVIAPSDLTDFTPLYCEQGAKQFVTHLDKDDLEAVGLVKFDFLGLRTLTIIDKAVKAINKTRAPKTEAPLRIDQLGLDDAATFSLLKSCQTTALFQLESRGMKDLIKRLQPDSFDDIVALVALFRPGPLQSGMVDDFIDRKHGRAKIEYPHPALEPILNATYGVILYQEQVMQIAQTLAGYSLGAADLLRRAMGKKKPEEMARQRRVFIDGAVARNVSRTQANYIFDLMEKFAGYGFNKSHSAAYALISYQTAWLKAHYPATFMAAALSADMEHTDKVVTLVAECRDIGIEVGAPNVNQCEHSFMAITQERVLYGLGAIKGVGESAIEAIVAAREQDGAFQDVFDLCRRVDSKRVNRRAFDAMIRAGALDELGAHRAKLMADLPVALDLADQDNRDRRSGQEDMFGVSRPAAEPRKVEEVLEWSEEKRLEGEKATLGLWLTGHPILRFEAELEQLVDARLGALRPTDDRSMIVAGLIVEMRTMNTRRGGRMAFVTLDDRTGRIELAVFSDLFGEHRELLRKDTLLVVEGQVSVDEYTGGFRMSATRLFDMDGARADYCRGLVIETAADATDPEFLTGLEAILSAHRSTQCPVSVRYRNQDAAATLQLGAQWRVTPNQVMIDQLRQLVGDDGVTLMYSAPRATPGTSSERSSAPSIQAGKEFGIVRQVHG